MGEEFDFWTKLVDCYRVEDVLEIIGLSIEDLYKDYIRDLILLHVEDFDID